MRDRSETSTRRHIFKPVFDQMLIQQEVVREFASGDIDLDELAEAIRLLLAPAPVEKIGAGSPGDPDLLSPRRRATYVVGAETP